MRVRGQNHSIKTAGLFFGLLFACMVSFPVGAVDGEEDQSTVESITLSPVSQRYELKQGDTKKDSLTIVNDGKSDYTFTAYARPYSVNNEAYQPDFSTDAKNEFES